MCQIRETLSEILDDEQRRMPYGDLDTQIRRVLATHPRTQQILIRHKTNNLLLNASRAAVVSRDLARSKELPPLPRAIRDQPPLVATAPVVVVDNEVQTVVAALADLEFKDGHGGTDAQQVLQSAALQVQHMLDEQLQREQRESLQTQEKALASAVPIISVVQTGMFDDVNLSPWEEEDLTHPTMLQDHNEMCQYANHNAVHQVDIAIPSVQHTSESLDLSQSNAKVRLWLEPMNDVYVTQQATPPPVPRQDAEEALRSPKDIGGNGQLVVEKPPRSRGSEEDARSQLRIPSNVIQ
eukprot:gene5897-7100_t